MSNAFSEELSTISSNSRRATWHWWLLATFIASVTVAFLVFGISIRYRASSKQARSLVDAIAQLKMREIVQWRQAELAEADLVRESPFIASTVAKLIENPNNEAVRGPLLEALASRCRHHGNPNATLVTANLEVLVSTDPGLVLGPIAAQTIRESLATDRIVLSEVYASDLHKIVHLDLVVPLVLPGQEGKPIAAFTAQINVADSLSPLVEKWPSTHASGEIVLVRREGDDMIVLTPRKYEDAAVLPMRFPLAAHAELPAVRAIGGETGLMDALDYRGVPIVAAVYPIPDTNWFLVAKVDQAEVYREARRDSTVLTVLLLTLLLGGGVGVAWIWQRRETAFVLRELRQKTKSAANERIASLMRQSNDAILLLDEQWRVIDANERAAALYGWSGNEWANLRWADLQAHESDPALRQQADTLASGQGSLAENVHLDRDGRPFPVECSMRRVVVHGEPCYQAIVRDIRRRKETQAALMESERRLATLMANLPGMAYRCTNDHDHKVLFVSEGCKELTGYRPDELLGNRATSFNELILPEDRLFVRRSVKEAVAQSRPYRLVYRIQTRDGVVKHLWEQGRLVTDEAKNGGVLEGFIFDISDRKAAEDQIRRANRALRTISECNKALVHATDVGSLLENICNIATLVGGYCTATVSLAGRGEHSSLRTAAWSGFSADLSNAQSLERLDADLMQGVAGAAFQTGKPFSVQDLANADPAEPWLTRMAAENIRSAIGLPLRNAAGETFGVFSVFAATANAFGPEETALLEELADDLAFGVETLRMREERIKARRVLEESEARYRSLFDNAMSGVAIHQLLVDDAGKPIDYVFLDVNHAFELQTGIAPQNLIGRRFSEAAPVASASLFLQRYGAVALTGKPDRFEAHVPELNRYFDIAAYPLPHLQFAAIVTDVTARKQAEERLALHREQMPLAALELNAEGIITKWNPAAEQIFGYPAEEAIGRHMTFIVPEENVKIVEDFAKLWWEHGRITHEVNENIRADGTRITCEWHDTPLVDASGRVMAVASLAQDITERIRLETALQHAREGLELAVAQRTAELRSANERLSVEIAERKSTEAQVRLMFDNIQAGVLIIHSESQRVVEVNSFAVQMFDGPRENLIGRRCFELFGFSNSDHCSLLNGHPASISREFVLVRHDESRLPVLKTAAPIRLWGRDFIIESFVDLSQQKALEAAMREAKEAAESASRAKSVFLANMSHEIRTPMNAILGYAQLLERDPILTPHQSDCLKTIARSGEHLLGVINDVLEMSKIEAGAIVVNPATFDLRQVLDDLHTMFDIRAAAKGLRLIFESNDRLPRFIRSDEGKLRQILINLLNNAMKYTASGSIRLRVFQADGSHRFAFEVEDTGQGIAPDDLERIFEPFEQASPLVQSEGVGLGLALCRQYAELLGGTVTAKSELGRGSVFRLEIAVESPQESELAVRCSEQRRVLGIAPGEQPRRILVVDDEFTNRELLRELLADVGFTVRCADDGREAIQAFADWRPDMVLMDLRMPILDGVEATRRIRQSEAGGSARILIITAGVLDEDARRALEAGAIGMIRKPFRATEILETIAHHTGIGLLYQTESAAMAGLADSHEAAVRALAALPGAMVNQMSAALAHGDTIAFEKQLDQVASIDAALAELLRAMLDQFEIDRLLNLLVEAAGGPVRQA